MELIPISHFYENGKVLQLIRFYFAKTIQR